MEPSKAGCLRFQNNYNGHSLTLEADSTAVLAIMQVWLNGSSELQLLSCKLCQRIWGYDWSDALMQHYKKWGFVDGIDCRIIYTSNSPMSSWYHRQDDITENPGPSESMDVMLGQDWFREGEWRWMPSLLWKISYHTHLSGFPTIHAAIFCTIVIVSSIWKLMLKSETHWKNMISHDPLGSYSLVYASSSTYYNCQILPCFDLLNCLPSMNFILFLFFIYGKPFAIFM